MLHMLVRSLEKKRGSGVAVFSSLAGRLVVKVTPSVSVSFFKPEFNDFLFAPVGAEKNEMPLSVLSALTRLDLDPWKEAAELSELPKGTATQRLTALIARLPSAFDGAGINADRLIELLPRHGSSKVSLASKSHGLHGMTGAAVMKMLLFVALGVVALILAATREPSLRGDHADAPHFSNASPPQTSSPLR